MKKCLACQTVKPSADFYRHSNRPDGLQTQCKQCQSAAAKRPHYAEKSAIRYQQQTSEIKARNSAYKKANRARYNDLARSAYAKNGRTPGQRESTRNYQARKLRATPAWANRDAIKRIYIKADRISRLSGVKYEVDHGVPLLSKLVCGLHCEDNLRIVPAPENRAKGNRFDLQF